MDQKLLRRDSNKIQNIARPENEFVSGTQNINTTTSPEKRRMLEGASSAGKEGPEWAQDQKSAGEDNILQYFAMPSRHSYLQQNMKIQRKRHTTIDQSKSDSKAFNGYLANL